MQRWWRYLLGLLAALLLAGAAAGGVMYLMWARNLPSVEDVDILAYGGETRVYDRKNRLIGVLTPSLTSGALMGGDLLELGQISQPLRKAVVSSEDRRFAQHNGIDVIGITRGLLKGVLRGDLEGGSSITQQLVKNTLLGDMNSARTLERKFKEAVLAYRVEQHFSKQQILAAYLNVVYWGKTEARSIVGIDQAAHAYFGKSAADLNLAESVYLAGLIPSPNTRYQHFVEYRPLNRILLNRMVKDGVITAAQAEDAWRTPIYPAGWRIGWNEDGTIHSAVLENPSRLEANLPARPPQVAAHYLQAVERELVAALGRRDAYDNARIITGLDLGAQEAAEEAARRAELPKGAALGMAFVDPATGEVTALVGQQPGDTRPAEWDNATQARRQVGSSVKPFVYTLALENGWKQSDTVLDSPLEGKYQPQNYDGRWLGYPVTLRYALDHSLNLPTVRLAREVGVNRLEGKLAALGFTVPPDAGLSLSIGTLEASPLQMASAYAAFANGGLYHPPSFVRQVIDARGNTIYRRPEAPAVRVWDERTAYLGLDMLRGVVDDLSARQGGLAVQARVSGWPVGGKTGTTNDIRDLWFAGVAPGLAGAVWVGREDNTPLPAWAYSGTVAAPIWGEAARGMLQARTPEDFPVPQGIGFATVRRVQMAFRSEDLASLQTVRPRIPRKEEEPAAKSPPPSLPFPAWDTAPDSNPAPAPQNDAPSWPQGWTGLGQPAAGGGASEPQSAASYADDPMSHGSMSQDFVPSEPISNKPVPPEPAPGQLMPNATSNAADAAPADRWLQKDLGQPLSGWFGDAAQQALDEAQQQGQSWLQESWQQTKDIFQESLSLP